MFQKHIFPPTALSLRKGVTEVGKHTLCVEKALNAFYFFFPQEKCFSSAFFLPFLLEMFITSRKQLTCIDLDRTSMKIK